MAKHEYSLFEKLLLTWVAYRAFRWFWGISDPDKYGDR